MDLDLDLDLDSHSPLKSLISTKHKTGWKNKSHESSFNSNKSTTGTGSGGQSGGSSNSTSLDEDEFQSERIIQTLTSKYAECDGMDEVVLGRTLLDNLRENIKAGICLICIEDVAKNEAIWSCQMCYCILHLVCIQRWARDSIANVKERAAERGWNLPIIFCCPKCRNEYSEQQFPDKYYCFCGKETNPENDPWNAPHSCGETCDKALQPECGHFCVLLCHAGPCPPCPKQITNSCFCRQSTPKTLRCFSKKWSCGKICSKQLPCNFHTCKEICHENPQCPQCIIPTALTCNCSSPSQIEVECWKLTTAAEEKFILSCGSVCGKQLDCKIHTCDKICHENGCGPCERSCPCGKSKASCIGGSGDDKEVGKPCGDSCDKVLDCGNHLCSQKCHIGSCGSCLQHVVKKCKCGSYEKEILCSKEFVCGNKCKILRDCKIHPCNRKCCPGDCPPCRNICGKTLSCKNHKCEAICHTGPCYPCPVTAQVKCRCGSTVRSVPCGSEKKAKPPDCSHPCSRPTKCDHSKIQHHRCHFDNCPKCRLPCGKTLPCRHQCPAVCHTTKVKGETSKPCPKCVQLVEPRCSLHRSVRILCQDFEARCTQSCGKLLPCGEHSCQKPCHQDITPEEQGGGGCGDCNEPCSKPRPLGCTHQCELGCHVGLCQPCTLVAKVTCHCGSEQMLVQCYKQGRLSKHEKSCKNQCPKKLSCSHRCLTLCHPGPCPELEKCRRKVKLACKCKHVKKEIDCFLLMEEEEAGGGGEGTTKILDCQVGICNIPKSPKETCTTSTVQKKRTRKKKTVNENSKEDEDNESNKLLDQENKALMEGNNIDKKKPSIFTGNLKVIGIIGLAAFITATILKYYGSYIISDEYRHNYKG